MGEIISKLNSAGNFRNEHSNNNKSGSNQIKAWNIYGD